MHWINFPLLYSKMKMVTTINEQQSYLNILLTSILFYSTKISTTTPNQPHLGVQILYLSQRALSVPPDYLSTSKLILTAYPSAVTFQSRSGDFHFAHDRSSVPQRIFPALS
jgi:hypothetical protein